VFANTSAPVPVSSVAAAAMFALDGVASAVATFAAKPLTPVLIGKPVALVSTAADGVPNAGVTKVGELANTSAPVPVSSVAAAAMFALDGVASAVATFAAKPLTPVLIGKPVALVSTAADGVPNAGVTKVGELANTKAPVPVSSVTADIKFALDGVASAVATFAAKPLTPVLIGKPVALVNVADAGVPKAGVTKVGEFANTSAPVPVSSVAAAAMFALDGVASAVATFAAKPLTPVLIGKPVALVRTAADGVPKLGVANIGEPLNTNAPVPVSLEITPAN